MDPISTPSAETRRDPITDDGRMPTTDLFESASAYVNGIHASYRKNGQGPATILRTLRNLQEVESGTGYVEECDYIRSIRKQLERILVESFEASNLPMVPGATSPLQSALLEAVFSASTTTTDIPNLLATFFKCDEFSIELATEVFNRFGPTMEREWGFIGAISECVSRVLPIVGNEILRPPFRDVALCALWQTPHESRAALLNRWAESASEIEDLAKELNATDVNRELDGLLQRKPMNDNESRRVAKLTEIILDSPNMDPDSVDLERLTQLFRNLLAISPSIAGHLYAKISHKSEKLSVLMYSGVRDLIESSARTGDDEFVPSTESWAKFVSTIANEYNLRPDSADSKSPLRVRLKELVNAIPKSAEESEAREARNIANEEDVYAGWGPGNRLYDFLDKASPHSLNIVAKILRNRNVPVGAFRQRLCERWEELNQVPKCESMVDYSQVLQVCSKINLEFTDFFEIIKVKMLMSVSQDLETSSPKDAVAIDRIMEVLCDYRYLDKSDVPVLKRYVQHRILQSGEPDMISLLKVMGMTFGTEDVVELWPSVCARYSKEAPSAYVRYLLDMLSSVHGVEFPQVAEKTSEVEGNDRISELPSRFERQVFQTLRQISGLSVHWRPSEITRNDIVPNFLCKFGGSEFILEAYGHRYQYIDGMVDGGLRCWDEFRERYLESLGFVVVSVNTYEWDRTPPDRRKGLLIEKFPSLV